MRIFLEPVFIEYLFGIILRMQYYALQYYTTDFKIYFAN
jgi:hypothetical protein